jgi:hypothetical protein
MGYNQCLCDTWKTENPFFLRNNCFLANMLWYYGSDHLCEVLEAAGVQLY